MKVKSGFTIIEAIISISVFTIISIIVMQVLIAVRDSRLNIQVLNNMKTYSQEGLNNLSSEISSSKVFIGRNKDEQRSYDSDSYSSYYLDAIDLENSYTLLKTGKKLIPLPISLRVLPEIRSDTSFSPEVPSFEETSVGNSIMVGSYTGSFKFSWQEPDPFDSTLNVDKERVLDLLNVKYYFLAAYGDQYYKNMLAFLKWESKSLVDHQQLTALLEDLDSSKRNDVLSDLTAAGVIASWDFTEKRSGNVDRLYKLEIDSGSNLEDVDSGFKLTMDKIGLVSRVDNLSYIFGTSKNNSISRKKHKVPLFANAKTKDTSLALHGFEVMINGTLGSRKVFLRNVSVTNLGEKRIYHETTVLSQGKDS